MKHIKLFESWFASLQEKHSYSFTNVSYDSFKSIVSILRAGAEVFYLIKGTETPVLITLNRSFKMPAANHNNIIIPDPDQKGLTSIISHEYQHVTQHKLKIPMSIQNGLRKYLLSTHETGAFFTQLYNVIAEIDENEKSKALANLRKGDIRSIFLDLLPEHYLQRKIFVYYFGVGDKDFGDKKTEDSMKERITQMIEEDFTSERAADELKKQKEETKAYENIVKYLKHDLREVRDMSEVDWKIFKKELTNVIFAQGFLKSFSDDYEKLLAKFKHSLYNEIVSKQEVDEDIKFLIVDTTGVHRSIFIGGGASHNVPIKQLDKEIKEKITKLGLNTEFITLEDGLKREKKWRIKWKTTTKLRQHEMDWYEFLENVEYWRKRNETRD